MQGQLSPACELKSCHTILVRFWYRRQIIFKQSTIIQQNNFSSEQEIQLESTLLTFEIFCKTLSQCAINN